MNTFTGKWLPTMEKLRQQSFEKACLEIADSDLREFKRHPVYTGFIANDVRSIDIAFAFYKYLRNIHPELLARYAEFKLNDILGSPNLYRLNRDLVSPGTLRFIKVIGDVLSTFVKPKNIIEIGSGYGGQCLVWKVFDADINYTLVDLPSSLSVANKYLKKNFIKHDSIPTTEIKLEGFYDLCISDYCLSEFDQEGVQFYIDNVLRKCHAAYITTNSLGMPVEELCKMLSMVYSDITKIVEFPKTSEHSNYILFCKGNNPIV